MKFSAATLALFAATVSAGLHWPANAPTQVNHAYVQKLEVAVNTLCDNQQKLVDNLQVTLSHHKFEKTQDIDFDALKRIQTSLSSLDTYIKNLPVVNGDYYAAKDLSTIYDKLTEITTGQDYVEKNVLPKIQNLIASLGNHLYKDDADFAKGVTAIIQLLDAQGQSLEDIKGAIEKYNPIPKIDALTAKVGEVDSKVDGVASKVDGVASKVDGVASKVDGVDSKVGQVGSKVDGVASNVKDVQSKLALLNSLVDTLSQDHDVDLVTLDGYFQDLQVGVQYIIQGESSITSYLDQNSKNLDKDIVAVGGKLNSGIQNILSAIQQAQQQLHSAQYDSKHTIAASTAYLKNAILQVQYTVDEAIGDSNNDLTNKLNGAVVDVNGNTNVAAQGINANIDSAAQGINGNTNVAAQGINANIDSAAQGINGNINAAAQGINANTNAAAQNINSNTNVAAQGINSNVNAAAQDINANIDSSAQGIKDNTNSAINAAAQGVNANTNAAAQGVNANINAAAQGVNANTNAAAQGVNANINAAAQGINSNVNAAAQNINSNTNVAAQNINSNTNVAAQGINSNVNIAAQGINSNVNIAAQGINSNTNAAIKDAVEAVKSKITDATNITEDDIKAATEELKKQVQQKAQETQANVKSASQQIQSLINSLISQQTDFANKVKAAFADNSAAVAHITEQGNTEISGINKLVDLSNTQITSLTSLSGSLDALAKALQNHDPVPQLKPLIDAIAATTKDISSDTKEIIQGNKDIAQDTQDIKEYLKTLHDEIAGLYDAQKNVAADAEKAAEGALNAATSKLAADAADNANAQAAQFGILQDHLADIEKQIADVKTDNHADNVETADKISKDIDSKVNELGTHISGLLAQQDENTSAAIKAASDLNSEQLKALSQQLQSQGIATKQWLERHNLGVVVIPQQFSSSFEGFRTYFSGVYSDVFDLYKQYKQAVEEADKSGEASSVISKIKELQESKFVSIKKYIEDVQAKLQTAKESDKEFFVKSQTDLVNQIRDLYAAQQQCAVEITKADSESHSEVLKTLSEKISVEATITYKLCFGDIDVNVSNSTVVVEDHTKTIVEQSATTIVEQSTKTIVAPSSGLVSNATVVVTSPVVAPVTIVEEGVTVYVTDCPVTSVDSNGSTHVEIVKSTVTETLPCTTEEIVTVFVTDCPVTVVDSNGSTKVETTESTVTSTITKVVTLTSSTPAATPEHPAVSTLVNSVVKPTPTQAPSKAPETVVAPSKAPETVIAPSQAPGTVVAPSKAPATNVAPSQAPGTIVTPPQAPGTTVAPPQANAGHKVAVGAGLVIPMVLAALL